MPNYIYATYIKPYLYTLLSLSRPSLSLSLSLSLSQAFKSQSQQHISFPSSHALPQAPPHGLAQFHGPMASFDLTALFVQPHASYFSFLVHFIFHCYFFVCVCVFDFEKENHKSEIFVFVFVILKGKI